MTVTADVRVGLRHAGDLARAHAAYRIHHAAGKPPAHG